MVAYEGRRPVRPADDRCRIRGLDDKIWSIIENCWAQEPDDRLSARQIVAHLQLLLAGTNDLRLHDEFDSSLPSRTLYSQADHPFSALADTVVASKWYSCVPELWWATEVTFLVALVRRTLRSGQIFIRSVLIVLCCSFLGLGKKKVFERFLKHIKKTSEMYLAFFKLHRFASVQRTWDVYRSSAFLRITQLCILYALYVSQEWSWPTIKPSRAVSSLRTYTR